MPLIKNIFSLRFIFGSLLLIVFILVYWHWMAFIRFLETPVNLLQSPQTLTINKGVGINQLAAEWQASGLISSQWYLRLHTWLNPIHQKIKVGEYVINEQDTPVSLLEKLSQGKVIQYVVTIVEGTNSFQLLQLLSQQANLKQDFPTEPQRIIETLGIQSDHIEGWFYPDTYHFDKNSSALELLQRAHQKMQQVLAEEWETRALILPYKNPYEALIMASIIEKETSLAEERARIAGVFVRRLEKNMRLGTDPTVIYGIGPTFNGDITYKNLRTLTPYNTYMIKGLPPTPIALPGRDSIHAALHPAEGEELYFVATGDGGHNFSRTLEEHNAAVKQYLKRKANK